MKLFAWIKSLFSKKESLKNVQFDIPKKQSSFTISEQPKSKQVLPVPKKPKVQNLL